jgi:hypothetical protein
MAGEVTFDDYMENHLAVPRYKGDSIAAEFQDKILKAKAAVAALRNNPRNLAMAQDSDAPIHFEQSLGDTVAGDYSPSKKRIRVAANRSADDMGNTLYHETIHDLQNKADNRLGNPRPPASIYPSRVLTPTDWRSPMSQTQINPSEGTPEQFNEAIKNAGMSYGAEEPAAWMAAGLNSPGKMDAQVRGVAAQFPGLSGMYAQQVSQPNRPAPRHYKGYPEMTVGEKIMDYLGATPPEIPVEAKYNMMQQEVLRRLNEQTNPRDRH